MCSSQPGVREPRENRGRLRHCNGLQTPTATGNAEAAGKAGARSKARSQDNGLAVLVEVPQCGATSPSREGWGQPAAYVRGRVRLNAFILRLPGVKVFAFRSFLSGAGLSVINSLRQNTEQFERSGAYVKCTVIRDSFGGISRRLKCSGPIRYFGGFIQPG